MNFYRYFQMLYLSIKNDHQAFPYKILTRQAMYYKYSVTSRSVHTIIVAVEEQ